uniref:Uncharacterized protein n=1 Tax=Anguilla anguilla TaxID=7936 RepID=A0A0E9UYA4_ANGAN
MEEPARDASVTEKVQAQVPTQQDLNVILHLYSGRPQPL